MPHQRLARDTALQRIGAIYRGLGFSTRGFGPTSQSRLLEIEGLRLRPQLAILQGPTFVRFVDVETSESLAVDAIDRWRLALGGGILYVHPSVPAADVRELVAWAKANPGALRFGSAGMGSSPHISAELFAWTTGIQILHTPYRGIAPATTDLIAGHINALFDSPTSMRFARDGKVRALAITQPRRNAAAPEVPTMAESGYEGIVARTFYGFLAPAAAPAELRARIAADLRGVAATEVIAALIRQDGLEPHADSPEEFGRFLDEQGAFWSRVIRERNITM